MNDELRLVLLKLTADGVKIEQVKIRAREHPHAPVRGEFQRGLDEVISNQPIRAGNPSQFGVLKRQTLEQQN